MSKETLYRQVHLTQPGPPPTRGILVEIAWIPSEFAKIGKTLSIKALPGLWTVVDVYDAQMTGSWLRAQRGEWKRFDDVLTPP